MTRINTLISVVILGVSPATPALTSDQKCPVHVTSDSLTFNYKTGIYHFIGNAVAIEGTSLLTGDEITTYSDNTHEISRIVAIGNEQKQASYATLPAMNQARFHSEANTIEFFTLGKTAVLTGAAVARQGSNYFTGPNLTYNLEKQEIKNSPGSQSQSTVVFVPAQ